MLFTVLKFWFVLSHLKQEEDDDKEHCQGRFFISRLFVVVELTEHAASQLTTQLFLFLQKRLKKYFDKSMVEKIVVEKINLILI